MWEPRGGGAEILQDNLGKTRNPLSEMTHKRGDGFSPSLTVVTPDWPARAFSKLP